MSGLTTRSSLVADLKQLSDTRWHYFVELYSPLLLYWLSQKQVPPTDQDDLLQECFAAYHKGIGHFSEGDCRKKKLRGWMRIILNRRVADHFRKKNRTVPIQSLDFTNLTRITMPNDDSASRVDRESDELRILELRALSLIRDTTSEQTWQMFWAYTVANEPIKKIAERFDVSENAVRVAKSRVLFRLRKLL